MRKLLLIAFGIYASLFGFTQTATDFTADDCNGVTHNLFTELDGGRVVVICWVMPCGGCIDPAVNAWNIVQDFQEPFSTKVNVYFYLVDDYGDIECDMLDVWANQYSIPESNFSFRFSDSSIDMMDYGSYGMPKTVVLGGGSNHTVFFNEDFTLDEQALSDAIETALASTNIEEVHQNISEYKVFPNPTNENSEIAFSLKNSSDITVDIYNLLGQKIGTESFQNLSAGNHNLKLDMASYPEGKYLIKLSDDKSSRFLNLAVIK